MPWIGARHIDRLIQAFDRRDPAPVVPVRDGRRGNPVLWPRQDFGALMQLAGAVGGRQLLARQAQRLRAVSFDTDAIFADVDAPADLAAALPPEPWPVSG